MFSKVALASRPLVRTRMPLMARTFHAGAPSLDKNDTFSTTPAAGEAKEYNDFVYDPEYKSLFEKLQLDHWSRALPIGFLGAGLMIQKGLYQVNEETMVLISGSLFAVVFYQAASGAIAGMLDDHADEILEAQNKLEDANIEKIDELINLYKSQRTIVEDCEAMIDDSITLSEEATAKYQKQLKLQVRNDIVSKMDELVKQEAQASATIAAGLPKYVSTSVQTKLLDPTISKSIKASAVDLAIKGVANPSDTTIDYYAPIKKLYVDSIAEYTEGVEKAIDSGVVDFSTLSADELAKLQQDLDNAYVRATGDSEAVKLGQTKLPAKMDLDMNVF